MAGRYQQVYDAAMADPETFWAEAAAELHWDKPWQQVLDASNPPFYRWFVGAETNTCYNALDRHVAAGHGDRVALIYDSPDTGTVRSFTTLELRDRVAKLAGAMRSEEHTSELQSLMRISYAVFCLKKKK